MFRFLIVALALLFLTCGDDHVMNPKHKGKKFEQKAIQLPCSNCRTDWVTITLQDCYADLKDCGNGEIVRYFKKSTFTIGTTWGYELLNDQTFKDQNGHTVYLEAGTKFCYTTPFGGCFIPDCACYPYYPCMNGGCPD